MKINQLQYQATAALITKQLILLYIIMHAKCALQVPIYFNTMHMILLGIIAFDHLSIQVLK